MISLSDSLLSLSEMTGVEIVVDLLAAVDLLLIRPLCATALLAPVPTSTGLKRLALFVLTKTIKVCK